jgi:peptidoglycan-associated lipoprotein
MHMQRVLNRSFRGLVAVVGLSASLFASACGPKYPNCEEDADCKQGEFCVNQLCQQCRSDTDCGAGQQCNAGACEAVPGFCNTASECGVGEDCIANRCQAAPKTEAPPQAAAPAQGCEIESVYFEYDSASLEQQARDAIAKNAQCMKERALGPVKITGYTDPRGTEEYNLALGDRRARAVEQYMNSLGVENNKLSTASMGEEMARGEDEAGWARDRRVEFTSK